jgi:formate--tetrahydrofolate ligase
VYCSDIKAAGAMAVLLKDAIQPNMVQTLENNPAFVHGGPFANIAHGCNSVVATTTALKLCDYVVTEAGFGADLGAEKFFNIKCRASGLKPDAAVIVATVRALKLHGGNHRVRPGRPLPDAMLQENPGEVLAGAPNLRRMIEIVRMHGVTPVVCVNRFPTDHDSEVEAVGKIAQGAGAHWAASTHFADGGAGAEDLAREVIAAADASSSFAPLYPLDRSIKDKIETIAKEVYGAGKVEYEFAASKQIERFEALGFGNLPICMAKTHLSVTDDGKVKGAPIGFTVTVREVRASVGAGFIYPLLGSMRTMPGLPSIPAAEHVDIDLETGEVVGLS